MFSKLGHVANGDDTHGSVDEGLVNGPMTCATKRVAQADLVTW